MEKLNIIAVNRLLLVFLLNIPLLTFAATFLEQGNASISPTVVSYNLDEPGNLQTLITWNDATQLISINDLNTPQDYVITDNDGSTALLTINDSYLSGQLSEAEDQLELVLVFDVGDNVTFTINSMETWGKISPAVSQYDLSDPENITTTIIWHNASEVVSVKNGSDVLVNGMDYTIADDQFLINNSYLEAVLINEGQELSLTATFDVGIAYLTIEAIRIISAEIDPEHNNYNLDIPVGVETIITWNDATEIVSIRNGEESLLPGNDFTVAANTLVISAGYLGGLLSLPGEQLELTIIFDVGKSVNLLITAVENNAVIAPANFLYDLDTPSDAVASITLNDASQIVTINDGMADLTANTDFEINGNMLAIKSSYLEAKLPVIGQTVLLTVSFDKGDNVILSVSSTNSNRKWKPVGIPGFTNSEASYTSAGFDSSGTPYVAFKDESLGGKASVLKYTGTSWIPVGTPGFSHGEANFIAIHLKNNTPYVVFQDYLAGNNKRVTVMKFNGVSWENVGNSRFSDGDADNISMNFYAGNPWVSFRDYSRQSKVTVMKFNGTAWVNVGSPGFSESIVENTSLAFETDGTPYLAWKDWHNNERKATVMKYDGASWVNVGNPRFSAGRVNSVSLAISPDNELLVAFSDENSGNKTSVMTFQNDEWVNLGMAGFSPGQAEYVSIAFNNNIPYVAFKDQDSGGKASVMKYAGNQWINEGMAGFSASSAEYVNMSFFDGTPHVVYQDTGNSNKASVMQFIADIEISNIQLNSFDISWSRLYGDKSVVFIKKGKTGTAFPENQTTYAASSELGLGDQLEETGWFAIYNGTDTQASVSGLSQGTWYRIMVVEYTGDPSNEQYLTSEAPNNAVNQVTAVIYPEMQASDIVFSGIESYQFDISWTRGDGENVAIFLKKDGAGVPNPQSDIPYAADEVYGNGDQILSSEWFTVYNGTGNSVQVSGLDHETSYRAMAIEYNGTDLIRYNLSQVSGNPSNVKTLLEPPNNLTYNPDAVQAFFRETEIDIQPAISGGVVAQFSIAPALPEGLTIDPVTGVISGIPWITSAETPYTITAENEGGLTTTNFTLTVDYRPLPETPISDIWISSVETGQFDLSWEKGLAEKALVLISEGESGLPEPVNNTTYLASSVFGNGDEVGETGWFTVYNGTEEEVTVTGLDPDTWYRFMVLPYNGMPDGERYLVTASGNNPENILTLALTPDVQTSLVESSDVDIASFNITLSRGNGEKVAVFVKKGEDGVALPADKTTYNASSVFGEGSQIGESGWFCVYNNIGNNFSVEGLMPDTPYRIMAFEYKGIAGNESYLLDAEIDNPITVLTRVLPPAPFTYTPAEIIADMGVYQLGAGPVHEDGGGMAEQYTISPELPAGLSLNSITGYISGIALELMEETEFTITATNFSGMQQTTVLLTVIDLPPAELTYSPPIVSVATDGEAFSAIPILQSGGDVVGFSIEPQLPAGVSFDPETGTIEGLATEPLEETTFTVTASNTGGETHGTFVLAVSDVCDLSIETTVDDPQAGATDMVIFSLVAINNGPSTAEGVTAEFLLPDGYTWQQTTGNGSFSRNEETNIISWTIGQLENAAQATMDVEALVNDTGIYPTRATINGLQSDPLLSNNEFEHSIEVADLRITADLDNRHSQPGDTVTFVLVANNKGPVMAQDVQVNFPIEDGYNYLSHTGEGSYDPASGWNPGQLNPDSEMQLVIEAEVKTNASYDVIANISGLQHDPDLSDNSDLTGTMSSNIIISMSLDNLQATTDELVTFTIDLVNQGPYEATEVFIHDKLPTGYTYQEHNAGQGVYDPSTGIWAVESLETDQALSLDITARVNAKGNYQNVAEAVAYQYDYESDNNTARARIALSDISINKKISDPFAHVGDTLIFTIEAFNNGPDDALEVEVNTFYPGRYRYISDDGEGSYNAENNIWNLGTLPNGESKVLQISATLEAYGSEFTATAGITGNQQDSYHEDNHSFAELIPPSSASLNIDVMIDEYRPIENTIATFTVTLSNNGRFYANDVLVNAIIPAGYVFESATPSKGTYNASTGVWNVDTLPNATIETLILEAVVIYDESYPYKVGVEVDALETGSFNNAETDVMPIFYPIAQTDEVTMHYKMQKVVDLANNDWDHYDKIDPASIKILQPPASNATVSVNNDGTITLDYNSAPQFVNSEVIVYEISNVEGLSDISEIHVTVEVEDNGHVIVPDAFSPNNDGINDTFVIPGIELYGGNELHIFNRWGNLVFRMSNYDNSWDGKLTDTNSDVPAGTYFYTLDLGNGLGYKKGYVYLAR